jgi:lipoyl(octanoyl) transferase
LSKKHKVPIVFKNLGLQNYQSNLIEMQSFTKKRHAHTKDEVWFLEHQPVYTYGPRTKKNDIPLLTNIPVIKTDRGGQLTFHGPGQLMVYLLFDLKRRSIKIKDFISSFEKAILDTIQNYKGDAFFKKNEPGIFIEEEKIVSFGLKITKGCSYHGASINISMDMNPWDNIIICGNSSNKVSDLNNLGVNLSINIVREDIKKNILRNF